MAHTLTMQSHHVQLFLELSDCHILQCSIAERTGLTHDGVTTVIMKQHTHLVAHLQYFMQMPTNSRCHEDALITLMIYFYPWFNSNV